MIIYQTHPEHGYHIAQSTHEAAENNKRGWTTVSEKEFYNRPKKEAATAEQKKARGK